MSTNDIGTKLFIATGLPVAFTEASYKLLTWVEIKGLVSIGEFGDDHETISVPDLTGGRNKIIKGAKAGATCPVAVREIILATVVDPGQVAALAASLSRSEYSFKQQDADTTRIIFSSGVLMSWKRTERSLSSYAGFTFSLTTNYDSINGTNP